MTKKPGSYGPVQLCKALDIREWQRERALADGLIPPPGVDGRWPLAVIEDLKTRFDEITAALGTIPDCGGVIAAHTLTERLGVEVTPDAIRELAARGILPEVGDYKGFPLYSGRAIERFNDLDELAAAEKDGAMFSTDGAAAFLQIRRSDFDHLVRAGLVAPALRVRSGMRPKSHGTDMSLYRAGDLRALLSHPDIDWTAVRSTPKGIRSPLAKLPTKEKER